MIHMRWSPSRSVPCPWPWALWALSLWAALSSVSLARPTRQLVAVLLGRRDDTSLRQHWMLGLAVTRVLVMRLRVFIA